jgi:DNA end-binding protein Ku
MEFPMAPRANWKGYLKLSLVSCAIALYPATSETTRVRFNTINRKTGNRVKRQFIDPETKDVVDTDDQVKGYAVGKDNFITVEDEELDAIKIESTRTIDIDSFVPRREIDPAYIDAPYYIAPEDKVSQEAFAVIRDAMRDKEVVGIGRVVLARRERPMILEPYDKGIRAFTLRYASEARDAAAYFEDIPDIKLPTEMKELAEVIIDRKTGHFDPAKFEDRYETAVIDLLKSKEAGLPPPAEKPETRPHNVINIMDALRRSIEAENAAPSRAAEAAEKRKAPSKVRATGKSQAPVKRRSPGKAVK